MQTIVELQEFQRKASSLHSEAEKQGVINYLAAHPQTGVVLQGTGASENSDGLLVIKATYLKQLYTNFHLLMQKIFM